jgi:5-methylcytosine-specific restriction endonuclease McrA
MLRSGPEPVCRHCGLTDARVLSVHHLDSNRSNNRLDNLIWLCHNCHYLIHHHDDEREALMAGLA